MSILFFFTVILCSLKVLDATQYPKLNIQVLYESLCPDSVEFITNQLTPAWKQISPFVNLQLIPFGKSSSLEDGTKFVCQHGPKECVGNRIQSCVIESIPDQNLQVDYVNCFMNTFRHDKSDNQLKGLQCAANIGLDAGYLENCYYSSLGTQLQLKAEINTAKFRPTFVPTIVYNDQFDQVLQDESLTNFKGIVCSLLQKTNPFVCSN